MGWLVMVISKEYILLQRLDKIPHLDQAAAITKSLIIVFFLSASCSPRPN